MKKTYKILLYFAKNIYILIGLVLIWRGMWYVLDETDILVFGKSHIFTSLGGIVVGLLMLYLPDHDLKEIQKL